MDEEFAAVREVGPGDLFLAEMLAVVQRYQHVFRWVTAHVSKRGIIQGISPPIAHRLREEMAQASP